MGLPKPEAEIPTVWLLECFVWVTKVIEHVDHDEQVRNKGPELPSASLRSFEEFRESGLEFTL
jgi:hypothetical protein